MAQLIVRNLEDSVREKLRVLAAAHGRTLEEEVREILRDAVMRVSRPAGKGFGTRLVERFQGLGACDDVITELRGPAPRHAEFDS